MSKLLKEIQKNPVLEEIYLKSINDFGYFCKFFFPNEVESKFSSIHEKVINLFNNHDFLKVAIAAPRAIGKTTLTKLLVCNYILFRRVKYIIYISNSSTSAIKHTEGIKKMLRGNNEIKKFFGEVKSTNGALGSEFAKETWIAFGSTCIEPRGAGQQIRGALWGRHRPGLIITDDLETKENVINPDQRKKIKNWYFSDVLRTEGRYGQKTRFIYIDTIKHEDALLVNLIDNPGWESLKLSICDENFNTYDPNYMTTEEIKREYEISKEAGEADTFYMELMNIPISKENAVFKIKYFKYFEEGLNNLVIENSKEKIEIKKLGTVVIVDPAKTVNIKSAESGIVVVSFDTETGKIFVREATGEKFSPEKLYEKAFDLVKKYKASMLAVEVTSLHDFISQPIKNYIQENHINIMYKELQAVGKKEDRISKLAIYYERGDIYHNKKTIGNLEGQLETFPRSKFVDISDAFAYILKIMEEEQIYFRGKRATDIYENEYAEIEELDRLDKIEQKRNNEWRIA